MLIKIRAHPVYLQSLKEGIQDWKVPAATKADMRRFVSDLDLGKVNRGKRISEGRQAKYLNSLKVCLEFIRKPVTRLTIRDVEKFEKALTADLVTSQWRQRPYSTATKVDLRKALKVYLRWRLGDTAMRRLAGWLDTRGREKTPEYLTEQEVEQLYRHCRTAEQRFAIAILFDAGARAEEFINIRLEDICLPEGKNNFVKLALKEEYSKTKGRTVSLYWRHSAEVVKEYLKERMSQGIISQEPVFKSTYDALRMFLRRLGYKCLKKRVHPHLFRHSSATYYATKLNRQELCYRYGWKFSSNMPDVYISRAGMENRELDIKFAKTEIGDLKDDFSKLQQETRIKDDRIAKLENSLAEVQENFRLVAEILQKNPTIADVEVALQRKGRQPRLNSDFDRDAI